MSSSSCSRSRMVRCDLSDLLGCFKKQWPAELSRIISLEMLCVGFVPVWIRGVKCPESAARNSSAFLCFGCGGIGQRLGEAW